MDNEFMLLSQEIEKSDAYKYECRIETLITNYYVFQRNYEELKKKLEVKNSQEKMFELWDPSNNIQFTTLIREIIRLMQNYLSSAVALVGHTRTAIDRWYTGTDFQREYKDQIASRFVGNKLTTFVEDLRNFNLHYWLPVTTANMSIINKNAVFSFMLDKEHLLVWSNWEKGKAFLSEAGNEIDICTLVDEYYRQIDDFHSWLIKRLLDIHKEDFDWLESTRQRARSLLREDERKNMGFA